MKIDGKSAPINIESKRLSKKELKSENQSKVEASRSDSVDTKLSNALNDVLKGIQESQLSAGDIHSNISPKAVAKLLNDSPVQAVRPSVSNEALLALADSVAMKMVKDPQSASKAFSELQPARVAELLSNA